MKTFSAALLLALASVSAKAQTAPAFTSTCTEGNTYNNNSSTKRYCETRDLTLASPGAQTLTIDGEANGGITVKGYDGNQVLVRAKVSTWSKTDADAAQLAKRVAVKSGGNTLRAEGPSQAEQGWAVSYEVFVPRKTALALKTVNGGISLKDLDSSVKFDAVNGGVSLSNVSGQVKGHTVNGGLHIKLAGTKWVGEGLDVETTNGGITWDVPKNYSAKLFTSTSMGSIKADNLPVSKSGFMHKEIAANLGQGGAPVRAVTVNGGIKVNQE
ncbi:DUF4097 family beta strand repeat-containing protein [Hymenobacter chitinivorans]|uniref:DUF4097 domain-containing protein n=1 Tax=Hymenobacter chitinivorans DSM 11115 TaxID=1121954 RepID=A0A2M9BPF8_9BACT|nr:DUF4097 family beta strand repeat-containing protein [Hymenobacter chitinivorans]PJJ59845.1 hypothetical protein CLV45_1267 [Hymenobacter chitinivorans DSM 11115]